MILVLIAIAVFLVVGILPTVLIITYYDKKPINPYLPALVVWLLGFLNCVYSKIISILHNIGVDPFRDFITLSIMASAVISSCISWGIAEVWARQKGIAKTKLRKLVMVLNVLIIILPLLYMGSVIIILYISTK